MDRSNIQPHLVSDEARWSYKNVQRLPHEFVELHDFYLYDLPHQSSDGLQTCGAERLRVQQRKLLSMPSIRGELVIQAMESTMPAGALYQTRYSRLRTCRNRLAGNRAAVAGLILSFALASGLCSAQDTQEKMQTAFAVKYVSADSVYLEGGTNAGLATGQKLIIRRKGAEDTIVARIEIESVVASSAVGRIVSGGGAIAPGDIACLSPEEVAKRKLSSENTRKYPQIISFTQDDPLDQEVREHLPKPPSPEVNRMRGRFGIDFGYLQQQGGSASALTGVTLRIDDSRLGGSYWNLRGYYRGYRHTRGGNSGKPILADLVNRTYHLSLTYDNPNSHWVGGVGRMLVPWASSLDTLDGFYLGRRYGKATLGVFGGSAPDPTSWDYDPQRQMAGGFFNFEGGSYNSWRYTSTSGIALTRSNWHPDRQFGFFQNGLFYKRYLSVYSDQQVDLFNSPNTELSNSLPATDILSRAQSKSGIALSRSYLTVRLQPLKAFSFDISENYFRSIPTFDERLLSTGLLDKYLFQGLSAGFHLDLPYKMGIYSTVGRSSRSGDASPSWDYLAGVTASDILHTRIRADLRYSRFAASFGQGTYRSLTLGRELGEGLQFDVQVGQQDVLSSFTSQSRSRFINGNLNWLFGPRYYLGVGFTAYRGNTENYRQSYITLGYRFDNRKSKHE
jgi:hypothetical protein